MIAQCLRILISLQWGPVFSSLDEFLLAYKTSSDPLYIREAGHIGTATNDILKIKRERPNLVAKWDIPDYQVDSSL